MVKYGIVGKGVGFVISDLSVQESWFVLIVSALTGTVTGALNKAVSFPWPVSSLKTFFGVILNFVYY